MLNVFRSFMAQAARGGRSRRNFSSLPEESTGAGMMIRELLRVATALPVGYFIGFLFHHNKLAAEKELIRRRLEKLKKLSSENDLAQVSWKQYKKLSAEYDLAQFLDQVSGKKERRDTLFKFLMERSRG